MSKNGNELVFLYSGNKLPLTLLNNYRLGLNMLIKVLNNREVKVKAVSDQGFIANVGVASVNILSVSNLATLNEIFIDTLYGLHTIEQNLVLLDIGMNVGIASLYFAALPNVSLVFGFEPFEETYKEALRNYDLNPAIKQKIVANNYGISNHSGELLVPALESGSAVSSTNQQFIQSSQIPQSSATTKVEVKSIDDVLSAIFRQYPSQPVYLKIDCEGEEYVIFEKLEESGYMNRVQGFLLEWHLNGPDSLVARLLRYGFKILSLPINTENDRGSAVAGMIYAFKD